MKSSHASITNRNKIRNPAKISVNNKNKQSNILRGGLQSPSGGFVEVVYINRCEKKKLRLFIIFDIFTFAVGKYRTVQHGFICFNSFCVSGLQVTVPLLP